MDKIIFLDVDGVLAGYDWFASPQYNEKLTLGWSPNEPRYYAETHVDPKCLGALKRILRETGAEIVLSSTWRNYGPTKDALPIALGREFRGRLISWTPNFNDDRDEEIAQWLVQNEFEGKFVIIDDYGPAQFGGLGEHLHQTNMGTGLTEKDADAIIAKLNA